MANNTNENNENEKVAISLRVDPALRDAIAKIAEEEDRPLSNMTERLIRASPKVRKMMAAEGAQI